jgi:hypothetical protein
MKSKRTNKIKTREFKYQPYYMSKVNFKAFEKLKKRLKLQNYNDLFSLLISEKQSQSQ